MRTGAGGISSHAGDVRDSSIKRVASAVGEVPLPLNLCININFEHHRTN